MGSTAIANCQMWLWIYRRFLISVLTPLLILPLPLIVNASEAKCGFVLILMAVYWCTECVPLAVTALLPVVLFPLMGIMTAEQVCLQYFSDTTILGAGGLMVAIAVEKWKLHQRLALGMLLLVGMKPALLLMGFMSITAFISMWITNLASTAIMLPIVSSVLEHLRMAEAEEWELQQSRTRGTSDIVQTKECIIQDEQTPEEILHAEHRTNLNQKYQYLNKGMSISVCYAASIGGTATLTGSFPNLILKGQIDRLFPNNGEVINYASWLVFALPNVLIMLVFSYLWLHFMYLGFNVKKSFGCGLRRNNELEAFQEIKREYKKLGIMSFAEWCSFVLLILLAMLWFTREPGFFQGWASILFNQKGKFVTDGTVSSFVSMLFFILPCKISLFSWHSGSSNISGSGEVKPKAPPTLLDWNLVQKRLPWNILLLLGGAFALAKGCEVSNLSFWLGQRLIPLGSIPPAALVLVLCLTLTLLTEICNNAVIGTILLPVLASMSVTLQLHPLYIMLPPTICSSFAFMLPVATPCNAITFNHANLKIMDMVKPGIVLNLLGILCVNFALHTWGTAMFQLNEFPTWANVTTIQASWQKVSP